MSKEELREYANLVARAKNGEELSSVELLRLDSIIAKGMEEDRANARARVARLGRLSNVLAFVIIGIVVLTLVYLCVFTNH